MKTTIRTIIIAALMAITTTGQAQNKNLYDEFVDRGRLYEVAYFSHYDIGKYQVEMTLIRCVSRRIFNALRHEFHLEDEDIKNVTKTYGKTLLIRNNSNPRQAPTAKDGKINLSDCCYVGFSPKEKSIIVIHNLGNAKKKEAIARFLAGQTPTVRGMVKE